MPVGKDVAESKKPAATAPGKCGKYRLDLIVVVAGCVAQSHGDRLGRVLHRTDHPDGVGCGCGIVENRHGRGRRRDLSEHLQLFCVYRWSVALEAGEVAAGMREAIHIAQSYRVADEGEHDWNRFRLLPHLFNRGITAGEDHVRLERDQLPSLASSPSASAPTPPPADQQLDPSLPP